MEQLWLLLLFSCKEKTFPQCTDERDVPVLAEVPTWHADVRPLVEAHCAECHSDGGLAPMAFGTYAETAPWAQAIAMAAADRSMPPWPPVDCCRPLQHPLALEPDQVAVLEAWAARDAPEGTAADYAPPVLRQQGLSRVDLRVSMPEAYTPAPRAGTTDDTRCFLLDWPIDGDRYVTGLGVTPATPHQVHHALLMVASPLAIPSLQLTDRASAGPGWSCPGGVVWGATGWVGGWSPGWTAREMPPGTGQKVGKGSKLILTVHYSVTDGNPVPDQSSVDLMLAEDVDSELQAISVFDPLWLSTLRIPANESDVMVSHKMKPLKRKTLVGVNLHMHERGSRGSVGIRHADGTETCLLQIDDWEHHWQGDYLFETPIPLERSDSLWVECHWDNTAGNQRVINGVMEEPRVLNWAEDEEMCVAFVMARD